MQWHYAKNGLAQGPVSEEEFQKLVQAGGVRADTLVWHEGLAQWTAYGALTGAGAAPPLLPPVAAGQLVCAECHQSFPPEEVIQLNGLHVCARCKPVFVQKLREGVTHWGTTAALWRKQRLLVMARDAQLPDRCVKCNAPADGFRLTRKLSWHPTWVVLMVCVNLLIYLIVAMITSRKATVEIGLCQHHREARRRNLWLAWSAAGSMVLAIVLALAFSKGWLALFGLLFLIAAIVFGLLAQPVTAAFIDHQHVHLRGVKEPFLDGLPEWPGA